MGQRFQDIFERARKENRCALIPYLTAGDPSLEASELIGLALAEAGADMIELGVPFSDPVADGPVIQAASERALARGTRVQDVLNLAARLRRKTQAGLLLFGYYNPFYRMGLERFAQEAVKSGVDGVLVTDLIPEEAAEYRSVLRSAGLDTVFLAAPTSPDERLRSIGRASSGFVYAVSRTGVTGARAQVPDSAPQLVRRLRQTTSLPIALGFGISRAQQVREIAAYADGAVVGTALVQVIADAGEANAPAAAAAFLQQLRDVSQ